MKLPPCNGYDKIKVMKRIIVIILTMILLSLLAPAARADLAVGYELLLIAPHAFVVSYNDKASGWGVKASADFGVSLISLMGTVFSAIATLGFVNAKFSFITLLVTKDINQQENLRDYIKAGVLYVTAKSSTQASSVIIPAVGIGREWQKFWHDKLSLNIEAAFPEVITLGLRYHF